MPPRRAGVSILSNIQEVIKLTTIGMDLSPAAKAEPARDAAGYGSTEGANGRRVPQDKPPMAQGSSHASTIVPLFSMTYRLGQRGQERAPWAIHGVGHMLPLSRLWLSVLTT